MDRFASARRQLLSLRAACILTALLAGCARQEAPPAATPAPTPQITPVVTPAPRNPVDEVLRRFRAVYEPYLEDLNTAVEQTPAYLQMDMDVREQLLRMQMVLQPPAGLLVEQATGAEAADEATEAESWSGPLFGAWGGSGSISGSYGDAAFSCALTDGGRITGMLMGSAIDGVWEEYLETDIPILDADGEVERYEGAYHPVCSISLALAKQGWVLAVDWRGEHTLLCIADDALYFAKDRAVQAAYSSPADWADWRFDGNTFEVFAHTEIEVPELEGENSQDA